ncbi:hypothetical protein P3T76_011016 [Phytophthora citrophthora]|uniref:FYVE-type domain-containing protein n=1 Tax=Phytophthora citrophthora TaxID=4793 RepID=A0AAD9G9R6_9STRA|nr:hypothetical protein P3T76_011016 [Phytophthora citrophthora]
MTRERFTINPFPALSLSGEEKAQLLQLGQTLIRANFERDVPFFKNGRKVDFKRWKLARERENMNVYTERPEYKGADALSDPNSSKLPAILSVGRVPGNLDDMMYGVVNPTLEEMRIKASYVHDFSGAAVLSTIVEPTADDPFTSVVVKWMEMDIPLRMTNIVQNRDYVYLECTGFVYLPSGERAGYHFLHSVDFPQINHLSDRVRGDLSICGFFRQLAPNVIDVCKTGLMDPAGDMIRLLAVPVMTEAFMSPLRYVYCGQMRKLTWKMEKSHAEARLQGAPNPGTACATCLKTPSGWGFGKDKNICKCCFRVVCSGCRIKKKISLVTADLELAQRKITFCGGCLATVSAASAVEIACAQIMENSRKSRYVVGAPSSACSTASYTTSTSSEGMSFHSFSGDRSKSAYFARPRATSTMFTPPLPVFLEAPKKKVLVVTPCTCGAKDFKLRRQHNHSRDSTSEAKRAANCPSDCPTADPVERRRSFWRKLLGVGPKCVCAKRRAMNYGLVGMPSAYADVDTVTVAGRRVPFTLDMQQRQRGSWMPLDAIREDE